MRLQVGGHLWEGVDSLGREFHSTLWPVLSAGTGFVFQRKIPCLAHHPAALVSLVPWPHQVHRTLGWWSVLPGSALQALGSVTRSLWHQITGREMRKAAQVSLLDEWGPALTSWVYCCVMPDWHFPGHGDLLSWMAVSSVGWRFRAEHFSHNAWHRASAASFIHSIETWVSGF